MLERLLTVVAVVEGFASGGTELAGQAGVIGIAEGAGSLFFLPIEGIKILRSHLSRRGDTGPWHG